MLLSSVSQMIPGAVRAYEAKDHVLLARAH